MCATVLRAGVVSARRGLLSMLSLAEHPLRLCRARGQCDHPLLDKVEPNGETL